MRRKILFVLLLFPIIVFAQKKEEIADSVFTHIYNDSVIVWIINDTTQI